MDLAQTTLMRCWSHWPKVQQADDRDAYVYRMLLNCLRDSRPRRSSTERSTSSFLDGGTPDPAEALGVAPGTVKSRLSRALALPALDTDLAELSPGPREGAL